MLREVDPRTYRLLAIVFALFVLFLYGPTLTITILSFLALKAASPSR